jgi:hypothetical protein
LLDADERATSIERNSIGADDAAKKTFAYRKLARSVLWSAPRVMIFSRLKAT